MTIICPDNPLSEENQKHTDRPNKRLAHFFKTKGQRNLVTRHTEGLKQAAKIWCRMSQAASPSACGLTDLPQNIVTYLETLTARARDVLEPNLKAIYVFGSAAYGAYEPGASDIDVAIVVDRPLPRAVYDSLLLQIGHKACACPARKLELVVYSFDQVHSLTRFPRFELNYNGGAGTEEHLSFDPASEASHWFLLDLAIGRELGFSLAGPPPKQVIAEAKKEWVLDALAEGTSWWGGNEAGSPDAVLNACRAWRWAETGVWGSKGQGAHWVVREKPEYDDASLVRDAVALRPLGGALDKGRVLRLLDGVKGEIQKRKG